jgi:hypothetical protein
MLFDIDSEKEINALSPYLCEKIGHKIINISDISFDNPISQGC